MGYVDIPFHGTKIVEVIVAEERIGRGVEGDPVRIIKKLLTKEGQLICEESRERIEGDDRTESL